MQQKQEIFINIPEHQNTHYKHKHIQNTHTQKQDLPGGYDTK